MELLLHGVDVEKVSSKNKGNRPLHFAAANNHHRIVELLLRSDAKPSVPNDDGEIPVELATDRTVRDILLRKRGMNLMILCVLL